MRTLAEPNLTAVSGESANFLAGGEFPIPVATEDNTVTIEFKEFGVGLAFTPVVMSEGRISLKISTEVSELSTAWCCDASRASPFRRSRSARPNRRWSFRRVARWRSRDWFRTTFKRTSTVFRASRKCPSWAPCSAARTSSTRKPNSSSSSRRTLSDRPPSGNLRRPTDGLASATDVKTYLLGHLNRIHGRAVRLPPGSLKDSYGFIVE